MIMAYSWKLWVLLIQLSVLGQGSFCMVGCSNAALQGARQSVALLRCSGSPEGSNSAPQLFGVVGTSVSHLPLRNSPYIRSGLQGHKQVLKPATFGSGNRWEMNPAYLKLFKSCSAWRALKAPGWWPCWPFGEFHFHFFMMCFQQLALLSHLPLSPLWLNQWRMVDLTLVYLEPGRHPQPQRTLLGPSVTFWIILSAPSIWHQFSGHIHGGWQHLKRLSTCSYSHKSVKEMLV